MVVRSSCYKLLITWRGLFSFFILLYCLLAVCILDVLISSRHHISTKAECNWYLLDINIFSLSTPFVLAKQVPFDLQLKMQICLPLEPFKTHPLESWTSCYVIDLKYHMIVPVGCFLKVVDAII
jgi:hypothetical protein